MPRALVPIITATGLALSGSAHAHGGEVIAIGLMQAIVVGFCIALLSALPKAPSRNALAISGLVAGVVLHWFLFYVLSSTYLGDALVDYVLMAMIFVLPVGAPVLGYCAGLWVAYSRRSVHGA